ncbi:Arm DNA-binding domain-containing protein [Methylophilus sp. Leaf408]|nr:Arm DNA-binding domain-containing protein [Methylophilus sp. Leaf408]
MALSDTALRNAKPADKPYKLYDERGLYLIVNPGGGKMVAFEVPFRR